VSGSLSSSCLARRCGLTLLELIIALGLGALLSLGMVSVYLESRRSDVRHHAYLAMQENGSFGLNLLRRELSQVGFLAALADDIGLSAAPIGGDCGDQPWALDTARLIDFIDDFRGSLTSVAGAQWHCLGTSEVLPGTDILSLKRSATDPILSDGVFRAPLRAAVQTQWYLRLGRENGQRRWTYVGPAENFAAADRKVGSGIDYWAYHARIYYIRGYSTRVGDGIPTLCVEQLSGNRMRTDCLVEGVENMQFDFGLDLDGNGTPDRFRAAPTGAELQQAVTARVHLLLRSILPLPGYRDTRRYRLGHRQVEARQDGFYRRVLSTTVSLRNRRDIAGN
jgi:type IV pilus assembly protein PilW